MSSPRPSGMRTRTREYDESDDSELQTRKRVAVAGPSREEFDHAKEIAKLSRESEQRLGHLLRTAVEVNGRLHLLFTQEILDSNAKYRESNTNILACLDRVTKAQEERELSRAHKNRLAQTTAFAAGIFFGGFAAKKLVLPLLIGLMLASVNYWWRFRTEIRSPTRRRDPRRRHGTVHQPSFFGKESESPTTILGIRERTVVGNSIPKHDGRQSPIFGLCPRVRTDPSFRCCPLMFKELLRTRIRKIGLAVTVPFCQRKRPAILTMAEQALSQASVNARLADRFLDDRSTDDNIIPLMPPQRKGCHIPSQSKPTLVTRSMVRRNDPSVDVLKMLHTALEARNACGLTSSFDLLSKKWVIFSSPQAPLCPHVLNKYRTEDDCRMTFHDNGIKSYWRAKTHCCDFYDKKLIHTLMENYDEGVYNCKKSDCSVTLSDIKTLAHPEIHPLQRIPLPSYMKRYMSPTKVLMNLQAMITPAGTGTNESQSNGPNPSNIRDVN
ncbi:hypothetical protein IW261DRAFT_1428161 [Armillaria novae-zelandiae]|uniref:Uncharacterized protein n=1 Tax=Armillaria novae-zelandiae TaxID=153914 RepID=A0AA39NAW4_9AGAR|nr:hypothetical protein IW261DRAFT_1428161 [Armillaria novae-zelandiae]